jgi:MYXO-CTERM domain-containing protein
LIYSREAARGVGQADEIPYDQIDNDCEDGDLVDVDGDGFLWDGLLGGTDCNDTDTSINPGAQEVCDGPDSDCDGSPEVDGDGDGAMGCEDCDDEDSSVFEGPLCQLGSGSPQGSCEDCASSVGSEGGSWVFALVVAVLVRRRVGRRSAPERSSRA